MVGCFQNVSPILWLGRVIFTSGWVLIDKYELRFLLAGAKAAAVTGARLAPGAARLAVAWRGAYVLEREAIRRRIKGQELCVGLKTVL
ncbi:hypothetical protein SKAU_G00029840 [Synaphobranchus kaupii]|uniref:Uncharacterized protein n=1 Tax=Synaphobranchus kaupii TaxID=118154 RepID=A0A9Q1GEQ6_SYNKA|nr:hypothetical protein SKAU_G00029840 [Synaphobranchus kaupii]